MQSSLLVIGAGGHARSCIDVIESAATFVIGGLIGQSTEVGLFVFDYKVIGTEADLPTLVRRHSNALIAVGQIKTSGAREHLFDLIRGIGFSTPAIVSPRSYVSSRASIGEGTIIMHGAVVNAGARIGRNCIINSQVLIEHDVEIGDHCHAAPGARINGGVTVGQGTFVGSGSAIMQGIRIGERCIVPMGASVRQDCPDGSTARSERR